MLPENVENERALLPMFSSFMKEFKLNQLFRKCHIYKEKGIPVKEVFQMIFLLAFTGKASRVFSIPGIIPFRERKIPSTVSSSRLAVIGGNSYFY